MSQSAAKSKVSSQPTDQSASQIAVPIASALPNDAVVATLAAVSPTSSSLPISVSSLTRADGIVATSGAASANLSRLSEQQHLAATSARAAQIVLALQDGAGAGKSGALAAWNSIEPLSGSAARGAAGKAHEPPITSPQVESASEVQSSIKTATSGFASPTLLPTPLASSVNRSTAVPVPPAFTISGEQRVPSIANDLSKAGSGNWSGSTDVSPLKSVSAHVLVNASQPVVASSLAPLAAGAHSEDATATSSLDTRSGSASRSNNLAAISVKTATATSGVSIRPLTALGLPAATKQINQQTLSQTPTALTGAASELKHALNANLGQNSAGVQTVAGAASVPSTQRSTVGGPSAFERAKTVGTTGAASQPPVSAPALVSQSNTDRDVSGDGSSNVASAHAGGLSAATAADPIAPPESFNGAGVSGHAISTLSISTLSTQGVPQGADSASVSTAVAERGSAGGQGSLSAVTDAESGPSANTLRAAISSEPHQTLVATPTSLEVGVHSGSQGWLKIRAEVGGEGAVSASLAAASPSGEQMLKGQLPALNAYLHSEQMSVTASVAERTGIAHGLFTHEAGGATLQAGRGAASGQDASLLPSGTDQSATGQGSRSQSDAGSAGPLQVIRLSEGETRYGTGSDQRVVSDAAPLPSTAADSSGQWLNVTV